MPFLHSHQQWASFSCSASSPAFGAIKVLDLGCSNRWALASHSRSTLRFPSDTCRGAHLHMYVCHASTFFGEVFVKVLGPITSLFLSFKIFWCVLDNHPLYTLLITTCVTKTCFVRHNLCECFLSVSNLSFHSLESDFCRTEIFYLMKHSLPILSSMDHAFCIISKKSLLNPRSSSRFSSMLLWKSFTVSCFTCRLMIHLFIYLFIGNLAACGILVPQPGIEPRSLVVKAQNLNHWTSREFPRFIFY